MLIKTSKLTGAALNWAVQEAEFKDEPSSKDWVMRDHATGQRTNPYSTDCCWGFPIIERNDISIVRCDTDYQNFPDKWLAERGKSNYCESTEHQQHDAMIQFFIEPDGRWGPHYGHTPLIAAMRCYCASVLGDEVEVPDELT